MFKHLNNSSANCLSVFAYFVGLALKRLRKYSKLILKILKLIPQKQGRNMIPHLDFHWTN